jgi:glyoxylase I family protein
LTDKLATPAVTINSLAKTREIMKDLQMLDKPSSLRAKDGKTALRQLSHTATRTRDMEAIRRFYEDFLGLPMVAAMPADFDVVTNKPSNYIHCFFQLADNSCIAFFQFEDGFRDDPVPHSGDPYEHHLALRVDDKETVDRYADRAKKLGLEAFILDHDDFYSLYALDPNGDQVEVTWHKPSYDLLPDADVAHRTLERWLADASKC